jgi:hypothetical protein
MSSAVGGLSSGESSAPVRVALLAVFLVLFGLSAPMYLVAAMWAVVYLAREPLARVAASIPRDYGFLVAAIVFGMLTESLALLNNLELAPKDRILLNPEPWRDLVMGAISCTAVGFAWLLLLRRFAYRGRDLFLITGVYGVLVEQMGLVALHIVTWPILGALYALLVAVVYGVFPMLALMVASAGFPRGRAAPAMSAKVGALAALLAQGAIVGLLVFPIVRVVVGA